MQLPQHTAAALMPKKQIGTEVPQHLQGTTSCHATRSSLQVDISNLTDACYGSCDTVVEQCNN